MRKAHLIVVRCMIVHWPMFPFLLVGKSHSHVVDQNDQKEGNAG